jgi:undecaprenyl pyrophosphate phosphatase UppP
MKNFAAILIALGIVAIIPQLLYAFAFRDMAMYLGRATGFALAFILPGVLILRHIGKKEKEKQSKGDIDATKTEETTKEKEADKGRQSGKT